MSTYCNLQHFLIFAGKFGARELRRLAIKKIIDSNEDVELKLRNIGTSLRMAMGKSNFWFQISPLDPLN